MAKAPNTQSEKPEPLTGVLVLANGAVLYGMGCGAIGEARGEICFNTAMTGYQEILTDPSYAEQIVMFTFPHIGNTGTNADDEEAASANAKRAACGTILREDITKASSWRSQQGLDGWLKNRGIVGLCGVDTRALTGFIRAHGMPNGVIAHHPDGVFDIEALTQKAKAWGGLVGADIAADVSTDSTYDWTQARWTFPQGYGEVDAGAKKVVVIDYGVKRNILRCLAGAGLASMVVPADMGADDILALKPDGVVLANGPGDPAATAKYAVPIVQDLLSADIPLLGICLGHQILALALGAKTMKM
ncbi:MAG TPA: carbamoyl-phosphate synthase small subunit, partial [Hellea balneolensis]|nr:carbamoyl-phosphate synthase small subunit [Hellea balneolensis]